MTCNKHILTFTVAMILSLPSWGQSFESLISKADSLKSKYGQYDDRYLNALTDAIQVPFQNGDYKTAYNLRKQHCELVKTKFGEESREYAEDIFRLGNVVKGLYGDGTAVKNYIKAYEILQTVGGNLDFQDAALTNITQYYASLADWTSYQNYAEKYLGFLSKEGLAARYLYICHVIGETFEESANDIYRALAYYRKGVNCKIAHEQSDALYEYNNCVINLDLGFALSTIGEKQEAIQYKHKANDASKGRSEDEYVDIYINSCFSLGADYQSIGDNTNAVKYLEEFITCAENTYEIEELEKEEMYLVALNTILDLRERAGEGTDTLLSTREKFHSALIAAGEDETKSFCLNANALLDYYYAQGNCQKVKEIGDILEQRMQPLIDKTSIVYFRFLSNMSDCERFLGDFEAALSHACELERASIEAGNPYWHAASLYAKAATYQTVGDIDQTIKWSEKCASLIESLPDNYDKQSIHCVNLALEIAILLEAQDYSGSLEKCNELEKVASNLDDVLGDRHLITAIMGRGLVAFTLCDYTTAAQHFDKARNLFKGINLQSDPQYHVCMNNLALCYMNTGQFAQGRNIIAECKKEAEQHYGKRSQIYLTVLSNSIDCHKILGDYHSALADAEEYKQLSSSIYPQNSRERTIVDWEMSELYYALGDFDSALDYALAFQKWVNDTPSVDFATFNNCYSTLSNIYSVMGEHESAIKTANDGFIGAIYKILPNFESYIELSKNYPNGKDAFKIYLEQIGKTNKQVGDEMYTILPGMIDFLLRYKQFDGVIEIEEQFVKSLQDPDNDGIVKDYQLSKLYEDFGKAKVMKGIKDDNLSMTIVHDFIADYRNNMLLLTESDRERYLEEHVYLRNLVFSLRETDEINGDLYNFILKSKGILLGANSDIKNIIESLKDESLNTAYKEMLKDKHLLDEQKTLSETLRTASIDELRLKIENEERFISNIISEYAANLQSESWEQIRSSLGKKDVAVEFFNYIEPITGDNKYVAMVLRGTYKQPEYVCLDNVANLKVSSYDMYEPGYKGEQLYNAVWAPLSEYIKKGDNVYYSSSGILDNINFSAICDKSGKPLGELYTIAKLSSTSKIAKLSENSNPLRDVALWGGLEYNREKTFTESNDGTRSGWAFLPGSLAESSSISGMLENSHIKHLLFQGLNGDEASFKRMNGQSMSTLHLSTHGFYIPASKANRNDFISSLSNGEETQGNAMIRCGLMMAGGNSAWIGGKETMSSDDGVMTALEIGNLDLSSVDLVVLSACETGLGDISNDGVLGLQRAFKNAGANTIVMSLWKVDDESTQMLMTEFYSNMLKGLAKRVAFNSAVDTIKNKYKDPYYWAAFIMMD